MQDTTVITSVGSDEINEIELQEFLDLYDSEPVKVKCGLCKVTDTASRRKLESKGWALFGKGEFCPSH